jgi:hypothetical protein
MVQICRLSGDTIEIEYHPEMQVWQYLRDVIAPAARLSMDAARESTLGSFTRYVYDDEAGVRRVFIFDYANRLKTLKDVIPADAKILVSVFHIDWEKRMWGNATARDVRGDPAPRPTPADEGPYV